jgi:polysaccharide biosynthesis protein PslG
VSSSVCPQNVLARALTAHYALRTHTHTLTLTHSLTHVYTAASVPAFRGVNIHFTAALPGEMAMLAAAFDAVRMDLTWAAIETAPATYNFSAWDALVADCAAAQVRPMLIFDYGNPLYDNGRGPTSAEGVAAFVNYSLAAVEHYHSRGIVFELWNEPNTGAFIDPHDYLRLARAVGTAIKARFPGECLVGPASAIVDLPYVDALIRDGLLDTFDAVTIHPYRNRVPETVLFDYHHIADTIAKYAPQRPNASVFAGEWGYTTCVPPCSPPAPHVTASQQAAFLVRRWLVDDIAGVHAGIWYEWRDGVGPPNSREAFFGVVEESYQNASVPFIAKPAYVAAVAYRALQRPLTFMGRPQIQSPAHEDVYVSMYAPISTPQSTSFVVWLSNDGTGNESSVPVSFAGVGCFTLIDMWGQRQSRCVRHHAKLCRSLIWHCARRVCASNGTLTVSASGWPVFLVPTS